MNTKNAIAGIGDTDGRTRWGYVGLLLASGVGASMQIGKVPPSLGALRAELHLSIVAAAWVISLFSVIGALLGSFAGSVADLFGPRRAAVAGLVGMGAASLLGSDASSAPILLASRVAEGMSFVVMVVAIPSLLVASSCARDRRFVPALWGTYMPIGMALSLAIAPAVLRAEGWRALWKLNAAIVLLLAAALAIARPPALPARDRAIPTLASLRGVLRRGPALLAVIFAFYTFQYMSVMGFLPTILQQQGFGPQAAGSLTAVAVIANALGNIVASALIARQATPRRLIGFACIAMMVAALGIFSAFLAATTRYALVVAFSGIGGLIPASLFASVPAAAADRSSAATTMGFVVQASHAGQLIGPPVVAAVAAAAGGWQLSAAALAPAAAIAFIASLGLRKAR